MAKHPAAFINTIAESGSKAEAIEYLQETWDELQDLKVELDEAKRAISELQKRPAR